MSLRPLINREFDLAVIGGGINGAAIAWDAALRGLSVVLFEKGDFGEGASAAALKIIHGGLRYLQYLDFPRVLRSAREQRLIRRMCPHLLQPLPVLVPCYGRGRKGSTSLRAGMALYDLLTFWRNAGVEPECQLPRHRILGRTETLRIAPSLYPKGLSGGVVFYDCQLQSTERFTLSVIRSAERAGACVLNSTEVTEILTSPSSMGGKARVHGVRFRAYPSGEEGECRARSVVNAAGPWAEWVLKRLCPQTQAPNPRYEIALSKGIQLALPRLIERYGVAVESHSASGDEFDKRIRLRNRSFFITPWHALSLIGTSETVWTDDPERFSITRDDVENFLQEVRAAYPDPRLHSENICYAFGGLRPTTASASRNARAKERVLQRDLVIDHGRDQHPFLSCSIAHLFTVIGIKYTTFRSLAERTVDRVIESLGVINVRPCTTRTARVYGAEYDDREAYERELMARCPDVEPNHIRRLVMFYGTEATEIAELMQSQSELRASLAPGVDVLRAEISVAARDKTVRNLADIIWRRTPTGSLGGVNEAALHTAAHIAGDVLGWSRATREAEVSALLKQSKGFSDGNEPA